MTPVTGIAVWGIEDGPVIVTTEVEAIALGGKGSHLHQYVAMRLRPPPTAEQIAEQAEAQRLRAVRDERLRVLDNLGDAFAYVAFAAAMGNEDDADRVANMIWADRREW